MLRFRPSLVIVLSFLTVIVTGAVLLSLPISSAKGTPTNFLDSFFTANSATCVTGLVVLDTGSHFSLFGLIVILGLIQIGGLGYMTFSTFLMLVFRHRLFVSEKLAVMEALNIYSAKDVISVLRKILGIVFTMEGIGAAILFLRWLPELGFHKALLYGIFHSVSAFCNAGFALPPNFANLSPYATDWIINLTITTLVIIGGLGFVAIADILQNRRWSLHTKVVFTTTLCLILGGTLLFFFLEYKNPKTLATLSLPHKILSSYFHAVTPRTAGFHTLNINGLLPATAFFTMLLMFIGASPGGTGGGIKTSTFTLIVATIWATLKNSRDTVLFNRRLPIETVRRAFTITALGLTILAISIFLLNASEKFGPMDIAFEAFSAFGTVGLSMGITPHLSSFGKIVIIATMFIGRIGPLTLLLALTMGQKEPRTEPPKEGISIG